MTNGVRRRRVDYELIEEMIAPGSRVLDLGCGDGALLQELVEQKNVVGRGVEINDQRVLECVDRGLAVFHGDLIEGLSYYGDQSFDTVILSQTLQQTLDPRKVLREMLRVGKRAIISFPNFGHWSIRLQLVFTGRMPRTRHLPHQWYDTPNVHLLTVRDFREFADKEGTRILREVFLNLGGQRMIPLLENWRASTAIFLLEKA
ncbi:MAG TPA: methionine biosynthesis protein MetW [Phycisphaerae bacterium]|nr:methionine biosynthesis protein MetW [Phycisphaerae bacterium]